MGPQLFCRVSAVSTLLVLRGREREREGEPWTVIISHWQKRREGDNSEPLLKLNGSCDSPLLLKEENENDRERERERSVYSID